MRHTVSKRESLKEALEFLTRTPLLVESVFMSVEEYVAALQYVGVPEGEIKRRLAVLCEEGIVDEADDRESKR